jgi:hypothetical protein
MLDGPLPPQTTRQATWRSVFGAPIVIGVLSIAGLLSALLLGEFGKYFSWVALAVPLVIAARAYVRKT